MQGKRSLWANLLVLFSNEIRDAGAQESNIICQGTVNECYNNHLSSNDKFLLNGEEDR